MFGPHGRPWGPFVFQMPKNLKRYYGKGDLHFITFSCFRRFALLGTVRARNVFVQALGEVRKKYGIAVVGTARPPSDGAACEIFAQPSTDLHNGPIRI